MFSATPKKLIADQLYSRFYGDIHTYIHRANSERDRHPLKCVEETPPKKIGPDYFTYNARNENAVKNLSPWQKFCRSSVRGEKGDASPFSKFLELWSTMVRATRETTKKKTTSQTQAGALSLFETRFAVDLFPSPSRGRKGDGGKLLSPQLDRCLSAPTNERTLLSPATRPPSHVPAAASIARAHTKPQPQPRPRKGQAGNSKCPNRFWR